LPATAGPDPARVLLRRLERAHAKGVALAPRRWEGHRADRVHQAVQRLADLAADCESAVDCESAAGPPARRPVPRLANDLALPDQLTVVVHDLLLADPSPEALAVANEELMAVLDVL
jgi:hypothetical protein